MADETKTIPFAPQSRAAWTKLDCVASDPFAELHSAAELVERAAFDLARELPAEMTARLVEISSELTRIAESSPCKKSGQAK